MSEREQQERRGCDHSAWIDREDGRGVRCLFCGKPGGPKQRMAMNEVRVERDRKAATTNGESER